MTARVGGLDHRRSRRSGRPHAPPVEIAHRREPRLRYPALGEATPHCDLVGHHVRRGRCRSPAPEASATAATIGTARSAEIVTTPAARDGDRARPAPTSRMSWAPRRPLQPGAASASPSTPRRRSPIARACAIARAGGSPRRRRGACVPSRRDARCVRISCAAAADGRRDPSAELPAVARVVRQARARGRLRPARPRAVPPHEPRNLRQPRQAPRRWQGRVGDRADRPRERQRGGSTRCVDDAQPWRERCCGRWSTTTAARMRTTRSTPLVHDVLEQPTDRLAELNEHGVRVIARALGLESKFVRSSTLGASAHATDLLIELTKAVGGTAYLAGNLAGSTYQEDGSSSARGSSSAHSASSIRGIAARRRVRARPVGRGRADERPRAHARS